MNFDPVINQFQVWVAQKIEEYIAAKPEHQSGEFYFHEHFFEFLAELQREGQRLLDKYLDDQPREIIQPFARSLQNITMTKLEDLQQRLQIKSCPSLKKNNS